MARKPKNITFETKRSGRKGTLKRILIAVIAVVAVLFVASAAIKMFSEDSGFNLDSGENETTLAATQNRNNQNSVFMDKNILVWSENTDEEKIDFMWLVNIKMPGCEVALTQINPSQSYGGESFDAVFQRSGEVALKTAVQNALEIEIDKFVFSDESSFKTMISYFDGVDISIPEQIEYKGDDMTLILVKGRQNMKGDTFYKYLKYLNLLGEEGEKKKDEAFYALLDCVFKPSNLEKRSRIYKKISNTLTTDITIVDFSKAENVVMMLMENGVKKPENEEKITVFSQDLF